MEIYETKEMEDSDLSSDSDNSEDSLSDSSDSESKTKLVKINEIPILKSYYEQITRVMNESNKQSLEALYLVEELSSKIQDKSDELSLGFDNVSNPLAETLKCISLTLRGLHELGEKMIEIDDDTDINEDLDVDVVKKEIKEEERQEIQFAAVPDIKEETKDNLDDKKSILGKRTIINENVSPQPKKALDNSHSTKYSCDICDYTTSTRRYLNYHKERHGNGKYKCVKCDYLGHRPSIIKTHMKRKHHIEEIMYIGDSQDPNKKYILCSHSHCSFLTISQEELVCHVDKKHKNVKEEKNTEPVVDIVDENGFQCTRCDYTTKRKIYFDDHTSGGLKYWPCLWCDDHVPLKQRVRFTRHLTSKHNVIVENKKFKCTYCDKFLDNSRKFLNHIGMEHGIGTQHHCNQCEYSSLSSRNLKFHVGIHDTASLQCHICGYIAQNNARLTRHVYNRHRYGYCDICNKSFKDKVSLFTHKHDYHGTKEGQKGNIFCDQCSKQFISRGKLNIHLENSHGSEKHCDKCDYTTCKESEFRYHMESRHGKAKYSCEKCDFKCTTRSKLQQHKQFKHENTSGSCDICGQFFTNKHSMRKHMILKHSTTPPGFKCTEAKCSYSTYFQCYLKKHVAKVHEGVRWPCDLCDFVAGYKGDLTRHKKVVHDGFILKCSLCEFKTPKKYTLKEHLKLKHGEDSVDIEGED